MPTPTLEPHDLLLLSPRRRSASAHASAWLALALLATTACGDDSGESTSVAGTGDATDSDSAGTLDDTGTGEEIGDPPTTWPEQIAFSTYTDGASHFGLIDVETHEVTMLSPPEGGCSFGDWSPDGVYMAYRCDGSLYVAWGDGSHPELLFEGRVGQVHWSPLGDEIAFYGAGADSDDYEIWTVAVEGGQPQRVTSGVEDLELLLWSHDGQRIAMRAEGEGVFGFVIRSVDVGSGDETPLHSDPGSVFADGLSVARAGVARGFIAYPSTAGSDQTRIWVMDFDGNRKADISGFSSRVAENPSWSPSGTFIAWTELIESDSTLVVAQPDGTDRASYAIPHGDVPVWSPDETRIAGTFGGGLDDSLQIVDLETGELTAVTTEFYLERPRWRPAPAT